MTVVLEDMNSKMDLLVDGYKVLDEKNDRAHQELSGKIDSNHQEFLNFRKETNDNFKIVFEYLSRIDDELHNLKIEIKELKNSLSKKADLERLDDMEKRVINVEKDNAQMRSLLQQHNLTK